MTNSYNNSYPVAFSFIVRTSWKDSKIFLKSIYSYNYFTHNGFKIRVSLNSAQTAFFIDVYFSNSAYDSSGSDSFYIRLTNRPGYYQRGAFLFNGLQFYSKTDDLIEGETLKDLINVFDLNTIPLEQQTLVKYIDCNHCQSVGEIFLALRNVQFGVRSSFCNIHGVGNLGNTHDTNLKALLGNPGIGNYTSCIIVSHSWIDGVMAFADVYASNSTDTVIKMAHKYIWLNKNTSCQSEWEFIDPLTT